MTAFHVFKFRVQFRYMLWYEALSQMMNELEGILGINCLINVHN